MNYYNYFTEIEEHFVRRRGKHLWVSPMDWSLIATWRDSGIPLHVALRGIDRAMDGYLAKASRSESKVSTLFYCHASVMEEYARHLDAHLGESEAPASDPLPGDAEAPRPGDPDKNKVQEFLNLKMAEIKAMLAKLPPVEGDAEAGGPRILARLEEIVRDLETDRKVDMESLDRDLVILDGALVGEMRRITSPDQIAEWEKEAKKELKVYRKKLPKDTYAKILENFLRTRIHRHFSVGELSLFHM